MDELVDTFVAIAGTTPDVARRFLSLAENQLEPAITLFFEHPELASGGQDSRPPPVPSSSRPAAYQDSADQTGGPTGGFDGEAGETATAGVARALADEEDDEAMARRMQAEMYGGGDSGGASGGFGEEEVRAPMERTTETLLGGPLDDWAPASRDEAVAAQMAYRQHIERHRVPRGVFNQGAVPSVWDPSADEATHRAGLAQATGGASNVSAKASKLAELYRPPFEIMNHLPWDDARDKGKEELKWLLINIQDPSIFICQQLNRDLWKNEGIQDLVKEHFLFMQYSKDDPRGKQYTQYYFPLKDNDDCYPHIAIVDPRTGEQVKVWSGPPAPKPSEFLMQLVDFLDRYSLDLSKKNPVAKRKPEKPKDIHKLTEDEMLELALQNSLATSGGGMQVDDPDDLTMSHGEEGKGKGKELEEETSNEVETAFSHIASDNPHTEPAENPPVVTRIQFRHSGGSVVRKFYPSDPVRRIYEWLKAEPLEGKGGVAFELKVRGKDLIDHLDETIQEAGLKNTSIMVEFGDN